jgi:hypothetical protein
MIFDIIQQASQEKGPNLFLLKMQYAESIYKYKIKRKVQQKNPKWIP